MTEKLYDRSRYRYRHYTRELAPIVPILQPAMGPARLWLRRGGGGGVSETIELSLEDTVKRAAELEAAGRLDEAEATLDRLLEKTPDSAEAIHLKGVLAIRQGRTAEGAALMQRSVEVGPVKPYYLRKHVRGVSARSGAMTRRWIAAAARRPAILRIRSATPTCRCCTTSAARRWDAILSGERALAINPNLPGAHFGLAEALLLRGEFERGWEEYEWRFPHAGRADP